MKILTINAGSSSLKASLFEKTKELVKIQIDGINRDKCKFTYKSADKNIGQHQKIKNHETALTFALELLSKNKAIEDLKEIKAVGHRVVHGGEKYTKSVKIDANVLKTIEKLSNLAPLHNPVNLEAIKAAKKLLPKNSKHIAVFDTSFHQTIPEKGYLYGLPFKLYKKESIRRYGFHGTNHKYVIESALKTMKKKKAKIVSCHIGNGSSITASIDGNSVDTSMGFTPLEGIIMGTRCGSIDPAITFHLQKNLKMKAKEVDTLLNKESGLLGVSGISSDMRDIYAKYKDKDQNAIRTIELLAYQIAKYIGSYAAAMNGLDAIVFTGGIGEKAFYVREKVIDYLEFLGFKLDKTKNKTSKGDCVDQISKGKKKIFVIKANEAYQIAKETFNLSK